MALKLNHAFAFRQSSLHLNEAYVFAGVVCTGAKFLCSVLVAPVRNESSEIILFILNLEDITDAPIKNDSYRSSLKNSQSLKLSNILLTPLAYSFAATAVLGILFCRCVCLSCMLARLWSQFNRIKSKVKCMSRFCLNADVVYWTRLDPQNITTDVVPIRRQLVHEDFRRSWPIYFIVRNPQTAAAHTSDSDK